MLDKLLRFRETFLWKALIRAEETVMTICGLGVTALLCFEVLLRYFFRLPLYSYEEVATIFCVWLYFVGAAYAMYQKGQIKADMASLFLGERGQRINGLIVSAISALVSTVLAVWSWDFIEWALQRHAVTTGLRIPMIIPQSSILIGYVLLAFYCWVYLFEDTVLFVRWMKASKEERK